MGDGGLALGAALLTNYEINGIWNYKFNNVYFGPDYSEEKIEHADYLIDSSRSLEETLEQTERVYRNLMQDYELKLKGTKK